MRGSLMSLKINDFRCAFCGPQNLRRNVRLIMYRISKNLRRMNDCILSPVYCAHCVCCIRAALRTGITLIILHGTHLRFGHALIRHNRRIFYVAITLLIRPFGNMCAAILIDRHVRGGHVHRVDIGRYRCTIFVCLRRLRNLRRFRQRRRGRIHKNRVKNHIILHNRINAHRNIGRQGCLNLWIAYRRHKCLHHFRQHRTVLRGQGFSHLLRCHIGNIHTFFRERFNAILHSRGRIIKAGDLLQHGKHLFRMILQSVCCLVCHLIGGLICCLLCGLLRRSRLMIHMINTVR